MKRLLTPIVILVAIHSFIIGVLLYVLGNKLFALFGWEPVCNRFFFHQVGVFHVVMAGIYAWEYSRYHSVTSILFAKFTALTFLTVEYLCFTPEIPILLAGLGDGCIGVIVAFCHRRSMKPE